MTKNRLEAETSPYLLQHKDNPVHWRAWGPEAFEEARAANKPVLLSVGYAACHWCHVMAHESFEDEATARLMNAFFVNVKVDREERPDVDALYIAALHLLGEQGGWPLTMFLTPDGEPFWGGTYFPKESRYGRPSFSQVLTEIARVWREEGEKVATTTAALKSALQKLNARTAEGSIGRETLDAASDRLAREIDPFHGGLGTAPKFPTTPVLELLWRAWLRTGRAPYRDALLVTLDNLCQGGIYDHLGGGFARYSVDRHWLVPHFEKMLYDNAGMIEALTLAHLGTGSALYRERIEETVGWVLREMVAEGGGFAASLDADSEGEEGTYYLWTEEEIDRILGHDLAPAFKKVYDVTPHGNFEGRTILNRLGAMAPLSDPDEARLRGARERLLAARGSRIRPGWDDKILSDWNGLMIAALVRAGLAFERADWLAAARAAFTFVAERMSEGDRLLHSFRNGRARHTAISDGYANMARAALALYEATGEASCLARAEAWVGVLNAHYWDGAHDGYFLTADDGEKLMARLRPVQDDATPAANGVMISVLTKLASLTGKTEYTDRAEALVAAFAAEPQRGVFGLGSYLNGLDDYFSPVEIAILGSRGDVATEEFLRSIWHAPAAGRSVQVVEDAAGLPATHPAVGKARIGGRVTAYLCRGRSCSPPVMDPRELAASLATPLASRPASA